MSAQRGLDPCPSDAELLRRHEAQQRAGYVRVGNPPIVPMTLTTTPPPKRPVYVNASDPFAGMNKTEKARALELEAMKRAGLIAAWFYEAITFKLADDTRYTPDFFVLEMGGLSRFEEIKGFLRDDALVKIKVAASLMPFRFVMLTRRKAKEGGGWIERDFSAVRPLTQGSL